MESEKLFNGVEISKLSKKQLKKYHKSLKWDEIKRKKRALEKQRSKEKRSFAKLHNIDIGPSRKELKRKKMVKSSCDIAVCIDLSFDHLMIDKDMAKAIKQVLRVYTVNRRARQPMQLHLTSFGGRSKEEMTRHHGYENWDINFHERDYLDVFPKDKLVYLSSESENVINQLEPGKLLLPLSRLAVMMMWVILGLVPPQSRRTRHSPRTVTHRRLLSLTTQEGHNHQPSIRDPSAG
ncbi:tRNA methyltransferase 10 homolog A isoform X3 [Cylas formicarius]|uniref:tRNA methyltransferase 10 homolog A isoform X3 n=1 Tax=Cylas formicarius TaxID=197179 RepID=UPI0029585867|nr:tRNA methyltransferase 10 homolog A isoform X3 [Cylas formicarius]